MYKERVVTFSNGVKVLCCTPHNCTFDDNGKLVEVEKCGAVLAATAINKPAGKKGPAELLAATFEATPAGLSEVDDILKELGPEASDVVLVGSMISAQAYAGLVCSMVPAPGYERVPPAEKRMSTSKFTVFNK